MFALSLTSINFHLSTVLVAFISQQGEEKIIHKNTHTLLLYIPMQLLLLELIYFLFVDSNYCLVYFYFTCRTSFIVACRAGVLLTKTIQECLNLSFFWRILALDIGFLVDSLLLSARHMQWVTFLLLLLKFSLYVWLSTIWLWCDQVWISFSLSYLKFVEVFGYTN